MQLYATASEKQSEPDRPLTFWLAIALLVLGLAGLAYVSSEPVVRRFIAHWQTGAAADEAEQRRIEQWVRQAWELALSGDVQAAAAILPQALSATADPGQVAFHWALIEYHSGRYREAEWWFARVTADAECPPARAARAWYNQGICLLLRGDNAATYRTAILCFRYALHFSADDHRLAAQARFHLELAKLLWDEARRREQPGSEASLPPSPPEHGQDFSTSYPPSTRLNQTADSHSHTNDQRPAGSQGSPPPLAVTGAQHKGGGSNRGQPLPGAGSLEPLRDTSTVQPLSPEDTRLYLHRTAERLQRDRQALLRTLYGPERSDLRDW
ncbi:MAG: hypothetical protein NZ703_03785 [Gemmataceae bacterium]|nr:hypothetical protein [Gemmataceae bacterium]MCS7270184.1 hypothetical protein [Gemmataceae bacterium]MDW8243194.1 hypothetical protein [Thermogemmata sp.]